jgi:hypothetical protein
VTDWIAMLATVGVVVAVLIFRWLYMHRIREGRADPIVDPSWPSTAMPHHQPLMSDPAPDPETSLYYDPDEQRGERDT